MTLPPRGGHDSGSAVSQGGKGRGAVTSLLWGSASGIFPHQPVGGPGFGDHPLLYLTEGSQTLGGEGGAAMWQTDVESGCLGCWDAETGELGDTHSCFTSAPLLLLCLLCPQLLAPQGLGHVPSCTVPGLGHPNPGLLERGAMAHHTSRLWLVLSSRGWGDKPWGSPSCPAA